jgi:hypothetical protein
VRKFLFVLSIIFVFAFCLNCVAQPNADDHQVACALYHRLYIQTEGRIPSSESRCELLHRIATEECGWKSSMTESDARKREELLEEFNSIDRWINLYKQEGDFNLFYKQQGDFNLLNSLVNFVRRGGQGINRAQERHY